MQNKTVPKRFVAEFEDTFKDVLYFYTFMSFAPDI